MNNSSRYQNSSRWALSSLELRFVFATTNCLSESVGIGCVTTSSGNKNCLTGNITLIHWVPIVSFATMYGYDSGRMTYRVVDPGGTEHVVDTLCVPSCTLSNVTSNGSPYVFLTSTLNKHHLASSSSPSPASSALNNFFLNCGLDSGPDSSSPSCRVKWVGRPSKRLKGRMFIW